MDIDFRHNARECLDRAKKLIAQGDVYSMRYACLELRFAIEHLVYQHLVTYYEELGDEAMKKWTPKQVIQELLAIDPHADRSTTIAVEIEESYGVPSNTMKVIGEDRRFSLKWANSNHNALGNFLHAPTLLQINSNTTPKIEKMSEKIHNIVNAVEYILSSPIISFNFGKFYTLECECGIKIKRRSNILNNKDGIKCQQCGTIWDIHSEENKPEGKVIFSPRKTTYECFSCGQKNYIRVNKIKEGEKFMCQCGATSIIQLTLCPIE